LKNNQNCKICNKKNLKILYHVAICQNCGVHLFYPYPEDDEELLNKNKYTKDNIAINDDRVETQKRQLDYLLKSGELNISNFTRMINFTIPNSKKNDEIKILDYGGGSGQFAKICKNIFPKSKIYIADLYDEKLLNDFKKYNNQIKFNEFENNEIRFDFIFLNDVFEHLSNPIKVLKLLKKKLKNKDSKIFIDTPKIFWIYNFFSYVNLNIYKKILNGTIDQDHQQIWTKKSFNLAVKNSDLGIEKYKELTEFTQPADFYLDAMRIKNILLRLMGRAFYLLAPILARNKIISVLKND
tara:strand:- start:54 stop:944 length:891 start_codon:yes stop_codon:yes gene_type:complete